MSAAADRLAADPVGGLGEADVAERFAAHGANELERGEGVSAAGILLEQVTAPMILLLAGAGVLSAALGDVTEAVVIFIVVALNAWIGFRQEYRAERAMAGPAMATPTVSVIRDGRPLEVAAREVVPGDLVTLQAGARVPADGRIVEAHALRVEESALTGESVPTDKSAAPVAEDAPLAERTSMVYGGTSGGGSAGVSWRTQVTPGITLVREQDRRPGGALGAERKRVRAAPEFRDAVGAAAGVTEASPRPVERDRSRSPASRSGSPVSPTTRRSIRTASPSRVSTRSSNTVPVPAVVAYRHWNPRRVP